MKKKYIRMKKQVLITSGLFVLIAVAGYLLYSTLRSPIEFNNAVSQRSDAIISKLQDIRVMQRAYKLKYEKYAANFEELARFMANDSLSYEVAMGSLDDSVAVAEGRVSSKLVLIPVKDTLFSGRQIDFNDLVIIPSSNGKKFEMGTNIVTTESGVEVPVFQIEIPYEVFLSDLDRQSLVNLIDKRNTEFKYPGVRIGSLVKANNDAGSWEE